MRLLLAEDERSLARALTKILEKNRYVVDTVYDGENALQYLLTGDYDVAVLDVMMPKMDGFSVVRQFRSQGGTVPVLLLTAKAEVEDRVTGLDSGADYYLTKPFDSRELLAALRAITRAEIQVDSRLRFGNVTLDRATFELSTSLGRVRLANKEFQLMEVFMSNPRQLITTERLLEKVWGYDSEVEINVVWVYISYLRKKLTALKADIGIRASRNAGYCLEELS